MAIGRASFDTFFTHALSGQVERFAHAAKHGDQTADATLKRHRKWAREGNPLPLVATQWPELLITDEEEAEFFEGDIDDEENPCLRIDPWQREILRSAFDVTIGEIAIKGATGVGKGFVCGGLMANLFFDAFDPCRINITSGTFRHAQKNLFGEMGVWRMRMKHPAPGKLLGTSLSDTERHYAMVLNPSPHGTGEEFSGMHSEFTVYFFDEASAVPNVHYENSLKNAKKIIALLNPRNQTGWSRDMFKPLQGEGTKAERLERENKSARCVGRLGGRHCFTIAGEHVTNVRFGRLKDPVAPRRGIEINGNKYAPAERIKDEDYQTVKALIKGQMDIAQYQSIIDTSKEQWEVDCYAHAKFPGEDPVRQAILPSWVEMHRRAWKPGLPVTAFGLDVARSKGGDSTVLSAGGIHGVNAIHEWKEDSYTASLQSVLRIAKKQYGINLRNGDVPICIDMGGGYGAGVADRLRQLGVWVIDFMPAGRASVYPGLYTNQRAEWYLLLGRRLDPADNWTSLPWALPPTHDESLADELSAPLKIPASGGAAWALESKADIKTRLGRSPDMGDSVVCLWRAVFERHALFSKMNETVDSLIVSETYGGEENETSMSDEPIDDLDSLAEQIERGDVDEPLPPPISMADEGETIADILGSLGSGPVSETEHTDEAESSFYEKYLSDSAWGD